jgi:hypothetical protein
LWVLFCLNLHYRIFRKRTPFYENGPKGKNIVLPYTNGPESTISKRLNPIHLCKKLEAYDVVSFDIFDTLILRTVSDPKDVFYFIGDNVKKHGFVCGGFSEIDDMFVFGSLKEN